MQIANEILRQLGGRKFQVMTGANNFLATDNGLRFKLPGAGGFCKNGINLVTVTLDPSDTYTVLFERVRMRKWNCIRKTVAEYSDIYNEQLPRLFEKETGLRTSL